MKRGIIYYLIYGILLICLLSSSVSLSQEQSIKPADAPKYIGEKKTVCGMVASTTYASRTKGQPTFLNLDEPYPNQIFTVVIWGSNRKRFSDPPERLYRGKNICATGTIKSYRGKPEITVSDPAQISIK